MNKAEFKKLQQQWYQKLAESGFRDIEEDGYPGVKYVVCPLRRLTNEQYFDLLRAMVRDENTVWKREIDRRILTLYSEGMQIRNICEILRLDGDSRGRGAVRFIIRRYEHAWKIKSYSRKQLHRRSPS